MWWQSGRFSEAYFYATIIVYLRHTISFIIIATPHSRYLRHRLCVANHYRVPPARCSLRSLKGGIASCSGNASCSARCHPATSESRCFLVLDAVYESDRGSLGEALEGALGGGEEVGEGVAADGGTQRTRQCLEDALNLVVLVGAASRDVEIHSRRVA